MILHSCISVNNVLEVCNSYYIISKIAVVLNFKFKFLKTSRYQDNLYILFFKRTANPIKRVPGTSTYYNR